MKKIVFTLLLSLIYGTSFAQKPSTEVPATAYIEVIGTAEKKVVPDIIHLKITLTNKIINKKDYTIAQQEQQLKAILAKLNIGIENLSLLDASSDIVRYRRKENVEESKAYQLKLSTAAQVSSVFRALHDSDIKEAEITKTDHTRYTELQKEVRINAIKAAKDKAGYLLAAIGQEPGKPLIVTENIPDSGYSGRKNFMANSVTSDKDGVPDYLDASFVEITIVSSYYVMFAIK